MSYWIVVDPISNKKLEYRWGRTDDFEDEVSLSLTILTDTKQNFSNKRSFLAFAEKYLHCLGASWINIGPEDEFCYIDLDLLKNSIPDFASFPTWFCGKKRYLIGIYKAGNWAYSDTFGRLTQTGENAEYGSYRITLSVTETDPIETIELMDALLVKNSNTAEQVMPVEIQDSMVKFREDYPEQKKTAFILMKFGSSAAHSDILSIIQDSLKPHKIIALRADMKEYHADLFSNVQTYIHGCTFGIAVFERIEADEFNPNVSLEVGYMMALKKPICFLKDKSLKSLHTDLVARLYRAFDTHDPRKDIPQHLTAWLSDYCKQLGIPDPKKSYIKDT